jgi:hypothetical protein
MPSSSKTSTPLSTGSDTAAAGLPCTLLRLPWLLLRPVLLPGLPPAAAGALSLSLSLHPAAVLLLALPGSGPASSPVKALLLS